MTRPIEEQRELCARFMGWTQRRLAKDWCKHIYGLYANDTDFVCLVVDYHPDEDIEQAKGLKDRLRELGYGYASGFDEVRKIFAAEIYLKGDEKQHEENKASESSALTAAVANLQASIEERPGDE